MKKKSLRFTLLITFLFIRFITIAQQFGASPSTIDWKQVNTDTVRVIFPKGLDSIAQRVAALTTFEAQHCNNTIGNTLRKVNIVLRNNVTYSNGYVSLAPYRSEFFLQPPVNPFELGAQSVVDNLAIHEFRHVQQYSNFRKGLSKTMYLLFGEGGQALANGAAVPDWFFEGDAVYNETLLSGQGRGRLPYFFNGYESLFKANKNYSYMKLRNGSYVDYIPNHYQLGYLLVACGREKYGSNFWKQVTNDAVRFKPLIYPWQNAVKKYAGISYKQFVNDAFAFYENQWKADTSDHAWVTKNKRNNVISYKYPYSASNGSVIVLKTSYKNIPAFYKIDSNKIETKIATQAITYNDYFSYNSNKIVYSSYEPDRRWDYREYSVIKLQDINTGKENRITNHTKYFTPDISHDGKSIVAVAIYPNIRCDVDLLDVNGRKTKTLISSGNLIYTYPKFSQDDRLIFVTVRDEKGNMSLQQVNINDASVRTILPFENRILGFPVVNGDTLTYSCSNNGRDEIWATIVSENKTYRLADYSTGLYQAIFSNNKNLIASAFTANGYRLGFFPAIWQTINTSDTLKGLYVTDPFHNAANLSLQAASQNNQYTISNYAKWTHPFNFHSWQPSISDPDYSFNLYGENVLNTLQSQLYYTYNRNERFSRIGYNMIYGGWYVEPVIGINETFNRTLHRLNDSDYSWNEFNTSLGLQLPLNFSGGRYYRYLTLSSSYHINNVHWTGLAKQLLKSSTVSYVESRIAFSNQAQKALQNIYPHFAQSVLLQYRTATSLKASQILARANFYFPGLFQNHSTVITAGWQKTDTLNNYSYANNFPFSRGYTYTFPAPILWHVGVNYHLPILYPDWGFGNIAYFMRIRLNFFYDYTQGKGFLLGKQFSENFNSAGSEIYFDTKWWNQQAITFGFRYSRLLNDKRNQNQWEFVLPVNLFTP